MTQKQAVGLGVLTANVLAALGGCWWLIEITPEWMQLLQKFLPTGWVMDAIHRLVSFEAGAASRGSPSRSAAAGNPAGRRFGGSCIPLHLIFFLFIIFSDA